jgi:hypothetical protein
MCNNAVNRDSTFKVMSEDSTCESEEFQVPCPSGRSSHPFWTMFLYKKDFSAKILENPVAQLSIRTDMVHRPDGSLAKFA